MCQIQVSTLIFHFGKGNATIISPLWGPYAIVHLLFNDEKKKKNPGKNRD
jgi:hypothetical protein